MAASSEVQGSAGTRAGTGRPSCSPRAARVGRSDSLPRRSRPVALVIL